MIQQSSLNVVGLIRSQIAASLKATSYGDIVITTILKHAGTLISSSHRHVVITPSLLKILKAPTPLKSTTDRDIVITNILLKGPATFIAASHGNIITTTILEAPGVIDNRG